MSFSPVDYYHLASWLYKEQSQEFQEAITRTIVSKAYYAAFLEARNNAGIAKNGADVHKAVSAHYARANNTLANRLDDLRTKRNEADYDTTSAVTKRNAGLALALSQKILNELGVNLK